MAVTWSLKRPGLPSGRYFFRGGALVALRGDAGATIMSGDVLTRLFRVVLGVAVAVTFFWLAVASGAGADLKAFDARYLQSPRGGPQLRKAEQEVFLLTNAFRKQNGREPLKASKDLEKAAAYSAAYMARTGKYGHEVDGNRSE